VDDGSTLDSSMVRLLEEVGEGTFHTEVEVCDEEDRASCAVGEKEEHHGSHVVGVGEEDSSLVEEVHASCSAGELEGGRIPCEEDATVQQT
jgi:hypothetical protein